ncbi:hypothetical protein MAPG_02584 [Magnaporthiopsis poae ATCC 64411]|uniref:Secreted protein n=1 Tax=Magnaporthiopsis poae (strain ATCC 64411 / 73-15) TaxID=644358 RepID=A0A0C4DRS0_MAGP6|nr:hypothetical protein MAPG_02584 [Magnaporthiopsis poae ATCC 64411]
MQQQQQQQQLLLLLLLQIDLADAAECYPHGGDREPLPTGGMESRLCRRLCKETDGEPRAKRHDRWLGPLFSMTPRQPSGGDNQRPNAGKAEEPQAGEPLVWRRAVRRDRRDRLPDRHTQKGPGHRTTNTRFYVPGGLI